VNHARSRRRVVLILLFATITIGVLVTRSRAVGAVAPAPGSHPALAEGQDTSAPRTIVARKFEFVPAVIEVQQNDLVKIRVETADIPHSFVLDDYRIAKRASPGHPADVEFRADKPGTFTFYCNLTIDDGCRKMKGQLIVRPR
jgi:heme/copper-type cytochrome/quinol oxidase subunit 2